MMEVTGASAAIHVDAEDTGALATAMKAALSGDTRVTRNRALMRARDFNWNTTARRTREVYDAAIRVFSGS
jgi:glycosyltransferase involved in cell wall biosynthesis